MIFEDDELLVVNKPAGLNTHAPSPYAGEGIYDWLRHREPRWASLAIIHRLDKDTSGLMVFAKTPLANRSLTEQFAGRTVRKTYLLVTDRAVPTRERLVQTVLVRAGEKYLARPLHTGSVRAETRFRPLPAAEADQFTGRLNRRPAWVEAGTWHVLVAEPLTGRTHQIRVHAAHQGFPVLGDMLYGGTPAARLYLHAAELQLRHPATGGELTFRVPADFVDPGHAPQPADSPLNLELRAALFDPEETNVYRVSHGASDGWPGWYVERLGNYLFSQGTAPLSAAQQTALGRWCHRLSARGAVHVVLARETREAQAALGEAAPERFVVRENGLAFELSFNAGGSVGLFLDQRDNRRRLLARHVAAGFAPFPQGRVPEVLNTFAYTCGFSVCAARAGARVTSLDLSRKHLDWGQRNFQLNHLDPAGHDFIYGDVFAWLRRLANKQRRFDLILLDPPTFSQSKESGVFRAQKDYGRLVASALPLLQSGGVLFASTNAADWLPEAFLAAVRAPIAEAGLKCVQEHYAPQPPDFPISRQEPAHLKTVWLRLAKAGR